MNLSDDAFWALERWIISLATQAAMPPGFTDPDRTAAIRDTAYVALTGRNPAIPSTEQGADT